LRQVGFNNLKIESLKAKHITFLASTRKNNKLRWLFLMLVKQWRSHSEESLYGLIPTRQPKYLVAIENDQLIAYLELTPNNRKGSSWSISQPEFICEPKENAQRSIQYSLLKAAIQINRSKTQGWLITSPTENNDLIEISRELGFQPLKLMNIWSLENEDNLKGNNYKNQSFNQSLLIWTEITKENAQATLRLKNSNDSVQLRQILDLEPSDILDKSNNYNGILFSKNKDDTIPSVGLISPINNEKSNSLEIIRDVAWDSRISDSIPLTLHTLSIVKPTMNIYTKNEDDKLNELMKNSGWKIIGQDITLGKTLLQRRKVNNLITMENPLDSVLERLKPHHPPLPSPANTPN